MKRDEKQVQSSRSVGHDESWLELVRRQVSSLDFGVVQIVVHGSRVVQIERTEKLRLTNPIAGAGGSV